VGEKYPVTTRMSVLFPEPFGPSTASTSPRATANDTPSSARVAP